MKLEHLSQVSIWTQLQLFIFRLSSKDTLSNRGHSEVLCLVLGEEVLKQLV